MSAVTFSLKSTDLREFFDFYDVLFSVITQKFFNYYNKFWIIILNKIVYLIMDLVAISQRTTVSSSPPVANIADEAEKAQTRIGEPLECWISQTFSPSYTAK